MKKKNINQIVILAGGLATRLHPVTKRIPKSMVEINGRPFLEYQIDLCKKNGVEEIVLCVGHLWEQIRDYFGNGRAFGVNVIYSVENKRLDTGGALKNALPHLDEKFFVMYGDSYLTSSWQEMAEFYIRMKVLGLMSVYRNNHQLAPSQLMIDKEGFITEFTKKDFRPEMEYIEYGLNIFPRSIINQIPEKSFPISRYFDLLIRQHQLISYESKERFYEIGCLEGLEITQELLKK